MDPEVKPNNDGGLSEADVARIVTIMRRFQMVARVIVILVAIVAGGVLGAIIAYRTGGDVGGVARV